MMYRFIICSSLFLFLSFFAPSSFTATKSDKRLFEKLFLDWTTAFNQKKLAETCDLFAPSVTALYQGIPQKNYVSICDGFKKIFQDPNKNYQYHFKLHHIYRSNNLAAIRITWYLNIIENKKQIASIQDEGLDILEKQPQGQWKIVNYVAFPVLKKNE